MYFLFFITAAILLEGTIISLPLVLDILLVFYILERKSKLFIPAFTSGIILDVFDVRIMGLSSIYFISFIFIVFLYERKFAIESLLFVFFSSFLAGLFYLLIFKYDHIFQQAIVSSLISVLLFRGLIYFNRIFFRHFPRGLPREVIPAQAGI